MKCTTVCIAVTNCNPFYCNLSISLNKLINARRKIDHLAHYLLCLMFVLTIYGLRLPNFRILFSELLFSFSCVPWLSNSLYRVVLPKISFWFHLVSQRLNPSLPKSSEFFYDSSSSHATHTLIDSDGLFSPMLLVSFSSREWWFLVPSSKAPQEITFFILVMIFTTFASILDLFSHKM